MQYSTKENNLYLIIFEKDKHLYLDAVLTSDQKKIHQLGLDIKMIIPAVIIRNLMKEFERRGQYLSYPKNYWIKDDEYLKLFKIEHPTLKYLSKETLAIYDEFINEVLETVEPIYLPNQTEKMISFETGEFFINEIIS